MMSLLFLRHLFLNFLDSMFLTFMLGYLYLKQVHELPEAFNAHQAAFCKLGILHNFSAYLESKQLLKLGFRHSLQSYLRQLLFKLDTNQLQLSPEACRLAQDLFRSFPVSIIQLVYPKAMLVCDLFQNLAREVQQSVKELKKVQCRGNMDSLSATNE